MGKDLRRMGSLGKWAMRLTVICLASPVNSCAWPDEDKKDNADRLREYRQSNRESLEQQLFSEAPIYDDLETVKLADSLGMFMERAGADN